MSMTPEQQAEIEAAREARHETRRPTVPALEEVLYQAIPVLDHGLVRVIDYMGDDAAIVQAARVSYGKGTKKVTEDRGLIRYLMRHRHTTPFEMCELKLHCKLPIFVARQWIRHRTACLAGDSRLSFDLPGAKRRGRRQHHSMTIEKLHRLWHEGTTHALVQKKPTFVERVDAAGRYGIPELARLVERREETLRGLVAAGKLSATRKAGRIFVRGDAWHRWAATEPVARVTMRERLAKMRLRSCDESTGEIGHTSIVDVWETGTRPVFRVTLENGNSLEMTKDHRCLTERGWMTLEQATSLRVRADGGVTWDGACPAFAVNGVALHKSAEWLAAQKARGLGLEEMAAASGMTTHTIRNALRRFGLQFTPAERSRLSGPAQRGQRRIVRRTRELGPEALERIRRARGGPASNFWRGGVTPERANIGRWTREQAARVHARNGWACVLCGSKARLHAHHVDPVWHDESRARDRENLVSLCRRCHQELHRRDLELPLLAWVEGGSPLRQFWEEHPGKAPRPEEKPRPRPLRLARAFSKVARIDLVGEEKTYDLAVEGPWHNFVANGFIVHNSVNEYSGRYSILDREFYVPAAADLGVQATSNRQGRGETLSPERSAEVLRMLREDAERAYQHYEDLLNLNESGDEARAGEPGLARELARMNLTLSYYTQWYWKIDLHNLLHFLSLRMDPHAQMEIRVYADAIASLVARWVPHAWEAFVDYRLEGAHLSRSELEVVRRRLRGETVDEEAAGLSKREREELAGKLEK